MIVKKFDNNDEWMFGRRGLVTGTKAGNLMKRGGGYKKGYYDILAEKIALPATTENSMDRGHRLETVALERFEKETGKKVNKELVIICREDNPDIAYSPDGYIGQTISLEVKCLNSGSHVEAYLTQKIPSDYEEQSLQPFVVNDKLKTLYFIFFDPRCPIDFFYFTLNRKDLKEKIKAQLELQRQVLAEMEADIKKFTF